MAVLVERDEQLTILDGLLAQSLSRRGRVVLLDGPASSGKTELIRTFAERSASSGTLLLNAACSAEERELPFGVLTQLFHSAPLPAGLTDQVDALLAVGMAAVTGAGAASPTFGPELVQVFHDLCLALLSLASGTPLLIAIDNVQSADDPSLRGLLYLVRRLGTASILVLLSDNPELRPRHSSFRAELLRQPHFHRIRLTPLSLEAVTTLLSELVGAAAARRLAPELFLVSGGNPFLVHALIEDHRVAGTMRPEGYGQALLSCLHRGEPVVLAVARALAVLGDDASPADVAKLARTDTETGSRVLRAMTASGQLRNGRFRHPIARRSVLDDLAPDDRSELHHEAAWLRHDQGEAAIVIARHLVEVDQPRHPWTVAVLQEAAEQAVLGDEPRLSAEFLAQAHRSCAEDETRTVLRARLAQAEWRLDPSVAARHLTPLTESVRAGRLDRRDRILLAKQLLWHGRTEEATDVLEPLRGSSREDDPDAGADLRDTERWLAWSHPPLARRRHAYVTPAAHKNTLPAPQAEPWLHSAAALADALARGQSHESTDYAEQILQDLRLSRHGSWAEESTVLALLVLVCADRPGAAADWCDRLLAEKEAGQAPARQAVLSAARAEIALHQGKLTIAAAQAQAAMTHLPHQAWGAALGYPLASLIAAATKRGDYETAARNLAHPVADALFQSRHGLHYLHARGHFYLATGRSRAGLADFLSCGELMRGWGLEMAGLVPWRTSAAEAWLRLGNQDQAKQLLYEQAVRPGTYGARSRGLSLRLLAATSPADRRPQLLTEALGLFEDCGDRLEQARVLTDLSKAHQSLEHQRRAQMVFRQAWHVAKECGATPLCQELFSITGDLSRTVTVSDDADALSSLTGSERRVASLAVIGHTNREIAAKLRITNSTVEQHLTRVYRKLNIKRRKELPTDLRPDVAEAR